MRIVEKVQLSSEDNAQVATLMKAYNLTGCHELPEDLQKPFGRIRGNDFSLEDARTAVHIVNMKAARLISEHADNPTLLPDPRTNAQFHQTVISSAEAAKRYAKQFLDALMEDYDNARA
ncbi:MAG: hypothetical protein AB7U75_14555 [Hyphomicrobiaceae bacterium]